MEKYYHIQFSIDSGDTWTDHIGSKYPYNDAGKERAITDIRYLNEYWKNSRIVHRIICVYIDVLDSSEWMK